MTNSKKTKRIIKTLFSVIVLCALICAIALICINRYVVTEGSKYILSEAEAEELKGADCILILGAGVYNNKYPSLMLRDRLEMGIGLYALGISDRILMSGDNGRVNYNEVKVMKDYAAEAGVPREHVFQDHAGFSTYESMYRARDVFDAGKIVIVTQGYHLYRALYDARALGLEAYGVAAENISYRGQAMREVREILARAKDAIYCTFKPLPTYLGEVIPVSGNGNATD